MTILTFKIYLLLMQDIQWILFPIDECQLHLPLHSYKHLFVVLHDNQPWLGYKEKATVLCWLTGLLVSLKPQFVRTGF